MTTLSEALADSVKSAITNVEITPRENHVNWAATSGATNVFEIAWLNFVNLDSAFGSLQREISDVIENTLGLTQQVSIAAVSSNAGSWYLDEGTSLLHVHTNAGTSPDIETVVYSEFLLRFSTEGHVLAGKYYEPRIASDTKFAITDETGDLYFGNVKSVASGSLSLINGDGMFDNLSKIWGWANAPVSVFFGVAGLTASQFVQVGLLEIEDMDPGRDYAVLPLRNVQKETHRVVPFNSMLDTTYPNMDPTKNGSRVPLLFGAKENITPVLIDSTVEKGLFLVADENFEALAAISNVYVDGVALSSSDLDISLVGCTFVILAAFAGDTPSASSVTCDATGPAVTGAAYETSTDYLKLYGELAGWLYTSLLGIPVSDDLGLKSPHAVFDSVAALALDAANKHVHASYIDEIESIHDILRDIERGVLGQTRITLTGVINPGVFTPTAGASLLSLPLIEESAIIEFQPDRRIRQIFSKAVVEYNRDPTSKKSQTVTSEDEFTKFFNLRNQSTSRTISTVLKNVNAAESTAQVAVFLSRTPDTEVLITDVSLVLFNSNVGDRVRVTVDRAPDVGGSWVNKVMDIRKITKIFTPVPRIEAILSDLQGVDVVGSWTDDSAPEWASDTNTDEEKFANGYWADDNGFIDPPDATSQNKKIWWV